MAATGFYQKKLAEQRKQQAIWDAETAASVKRGEEINKQIAYRNNRKNQLVPQINVTKGNGQVIPAYGATGSFPPVSSGVTASYPTAIYNNTSQDGGRNQRSGYAAYNGVPAMGAAVTQMQSAKPTEVPLMSNNSSGLNPITSAVSGWVNPFKEGAEATGEAAGRSIGGTVDNIVDGVTAYGGMVADAAGNLVSGTSDAASGIAAGFTGSRDPKSVVPNLPTRPTTQSDVDDYSRSNVVPMNTRATTDKDVSDYSRTPINTDDVVAPKLEAAKTPTLDLSKTSTGSKYDHLDPDPDKVEPVIVPGPSGDTLVKPLTEEQVAAEAVKTATDTGTEDLSGVNTQTFEATDGNGKKIPVEPEQVKGIFDKASSLFGDTFSGSDLRRMTLYTLGGLLSGGSLQGSFKWAGMKVMEEQGISKANQAKKDEKTLEFERTLKGKEIDQDNRELTAENLAETNIEAKAIVAQATLDWNNATGQAKIVAAKVLAQAKKQADKITRLIAADKVKRNDKTGSTTGTEHTYRVEGLEKYGITDVVAQEYYINGTSKGWRVANPMYGQEGQPEYISKALFKRMLYEDYNGSWKKGEADLPSESVEKRADRISKFSGEISGSIEKIFGPDNLDAGMQAASSVQTYFDSRSFDLSDATEQGHARQIAIRTAVEAKNDAMNGKGGTTLAPYLDKYAFSVKAKSSGGGVWALPNSTGTVDTKKINILIDKMRGSAGGESGSRENFDLARDRFVDYYKDYSTQKSNDTLPTNIKFGDDENEFFAWLTAKLAPLK